MSILTALRDHKITWNQAETEIVQWGAHLFAAAPPEVHDAIDIAISDVKQAASDAISVADTLAGPLLNGAADAVGAAFVGAASKYLGPFGGAVTPAALDAIDRVRDGLIAELHTEALALKAQLAAAAPAKAA